MKKTLMTSLFAAGILLGQTKRAEDLSVAEIEGLLAAQVPSDVIVLKVKQSHATFNLSTADILALKKAGASADLLRAMMEPAGLAESAGAIDKQEITIPDGTEVRLLLKNPLSSATAQPEQRVEFMASEAVVVHGVTIIEKGARSRACHRGAAEEGFRPKGQAELQHRHRAVRFRGEHPAAIQQNC